MKNITLSIDEDILKVGREYARRHDMSFNVLVRKLIQQTVEANSEKWLEDTFLLMDKANLSSGNQTWTR